MNGFQPSTNFIGALGEYPIFDYINDNVSGIKRLIDGTSNTKIDETGLQVYHEDILNPLTSNGWVNVESRLEQNKNAITSIEANLSGLEGEIGTLQGEVATNTAAIADITPIVTAHTIAIGGLVPLVGGHTIAITGLVTDVGNCLKKVNIDAGDIGLYQTIGGAFLNIVYNTNHFKDVPVLATNREFNLKDEYANLPTTKNNKITWSSPLNYNTVSDTASIDLSNYYTIAQTNTAINSNLSYYVSSNTFNNVMTNYTTNVSLSNQFYMSSNAVANLYMSSNVFSNVMLNYATNVSLSNQLYMSSNTVAKLYISSNVFSNVMLNYVSTAGLSNQFYMSSNTVANLYISSNVFSNTMLNYVTNVGLSNQFYMSSNAVANLYISSNVFSNTMLNYVTNIGLSNQLYISSNTVANLYISSNVFSNTMLNYVTNVGLSNQLYISSNVLSKILTPYTTSNFISSSYLPKVFTNSNRDIYFDTSIQILSNTQPIDGYKLQNSSLMVGDGGRLLINGTFSNQIGSNVSRIGVADISASGGGLKNTNITLYENGYITYYAAVPNNTFYGHSFSGKVQMDTLYVGAILGATNLAVKSTFSITADQQKTINGISVYKYDLDISQYTSYFQAVGYKVRHFKITSIYSNASCMDGSNPEFTKYMFSNEYYMTDYNGLTLACSDSWTNGQCEFISNTIPINYWIRNSFNYMTFINQLSIGGNRTWYIMVTDYLS